MVEPSIVDTVPEGHWTMLEGPGVGAWVGIGVEIGVGAGVDVGALHSLGVQFLWVQRFWAAPQFDPVQQYPLEESSGAGAQSSSLWHDPQSPTFPEEEELSVPQEEPVSTIQVSPPHSGASFLQNTCLLFLQVDSPTAKLPQLLVG